MAGCGGGSTLEAGRGGGPRGSVRKVRRRWRGKQLVLVLVRREGDADHAGASKATIAKVHHGVIIWHKRD